MAPRFSFHRYVRENPDGDAPDALLVCPRCNEQKAPDHFYLRNARRRLVETGTTRGCCVICRDCQRSRNTRYRSEKVAIITAAKAGGCVDCGMVNLTHPEIFDFDHVQPGKVKTITQWLTSGTVDDLRAEMARCEVVCANCHRIRTVARPHGKTGWDLR